MVGEESPATTAAGPSRSTVPSIPGTGDLWSEILDSVSSSRGVVTKNVIVVGQHNSGKSTIVSRISSVTGEAPPVDDKKETLDLGLTYNVIEVGDGADEDPLARLGVYQLSSPSPPFSSLLPLTLNPATLLDSIVVVVLDWERPWVFLRDLRAWLSAVSSLLETFRDAWELSTAQERISSSIKHFKDSSGSTTTTSTTAMNLADEEAPLGPGVLTHNLGIPLVIVCNKADQISTLERDSGYKEEQFDFIQQVLRTIALQYGAALFYTSHSRPSSYSTLREYILHCLFAKSALTPAVKSSTRATRSTENSSTIMFPFTHRVNAVDRDQIMIPAGWDSWGKIKILRDRFDTEALCERWEVDMSSVPKLSEAPNEHPAHHGALEMYEEVIVDGRAHIPALGHANDVIVAQDEQTFLKQHYDFLQNAQAKDPRAAFASKGSIGPGGSDVNFGTSVVGPSSSAGMALPSVEKLLDRDTTDVNARIANMARKTSSQGGTRSPVIPGGSPPPGSVGSGSSNPASATSPRASSPVAGQGQNEVLANFFQSLLAARNTGTGSTRSGGLQALSPTAESRTTGSHAGSPPVDSRPNSQQK